MRRAVIVLLLLCLPASRTGAEPFALEDGDRVVLIGSTLIEREQREGYWETALTRRFPGKAIQVRNLGWSGDTVFADSRGGFGTAADGFRLLREHVHKLNPTVVVVAYGGNEAFAGPQGLPRFITGLNTLLDAVTPAQSQLVLLSPPPQENLGPPWPNPAEHNRNLRRYGDAIRTVAGKRGARFADLYELLADTSAGPRTSNGLHLTPWGYWSSAPQLERALGWKAPGWDVELGGGQLTRASGARVEDVRSTSGDSNSLRFRATDELLPLPPAPVDGAPSNKAPRPLAAAGQRILRVTDLPSGSYTLSIDDKECITADSKQWSKGVALGHTPESDQAERLRRAIVRKNRLYFYRWRPQNETYLFGFRKHEQGQNAREVPQFDPLIAREEEEIKRLSSPTPHTYELKAAAR